MAFSERLKIEMRKRTDFRCCICHNIGVEIHHIVPLRENGSDDAENAAPLCPSCHDLFGANREKRKFIREARDNWFEILQKRKEDTSAFWGSFSDMVESLPTKEELLQAKSEIIGAISDAKIPSDLNEDQDASIGDILRFIYNIEDDTIEESDIDFLFEFAFGGEMDNKGFELAKNAFIDEFGIASARRLCAWVLRDHQFRPSRPFTINHLNDFWKELFSGLTLFLNHKDVTPNKPGYSAFIAKDGSDILWYVKEDESDISANSDAS